MIMALSISLLTDNTSSIAPYSGSTQSPTQDLLVGKHYIKATINIKHVHTLHENKTQTDISICFRVYNRKASKKGNCTT